ncbi:MAG: STAS/SEC14 domain-containing protein [Methylovirgula sp.]
MIEQLTGFPDGTLAFVCHGKVTKADYERVIVPAAEKAGKEHGKIRLYYEIGHEFSGIEPGAMWEDFKVGMGHLSQWERIAVVTDVDWIKLAVEAFRFLMPGKLRVFPTAEAEAARAWIVA